MARKTRREPEHDAHAAGADYAREQLAGAYFQDWVWEQTVEAERMRQADPNSVIDASTPAGARKVAKNMLQQLKWDTKRALKESKEFFEGFDEVLQSQSSIDWLADMILDFDKEARERGAPEAREAYGRRGRRSGGDVPRYKRDEEEWQRRRSEYQAKVEPLKTGLVRIVGGDELLRRGIQIPTNGVIVASLSDPRRQNEPVAHFRRYPGFGYGEDGGLGQTYFVDPAIVPAGKETREARSTETMTPEQRDIIVAALRHYGADLSSDGFITHGEKVLSVRPEVKKGRLRMVAPDGNVLATYPVSKLASGVADFVERFWYWKPAEAPAGKEAREARRGSRGKKTFEAYALEVEQALVASGVRPGQAAVWTSNHGAFIDKELKDGASANDTAERILESERESSIPYGRESRRPVAPYYSRKR